MTPVNLKTCIFRLFVICGVLILISNNAGYSQVPILQDSIYPSDDQNFTNRNFYHTDSIFSFRSQKGYFPSLIHNIGVQAAAPFHFKTRQWLYAGAAAGITTVLLFTDEDIDAWARRLKSDHKWINRSSPFITEFGSKYGLGVVVANGLISAVFKNEKGVQTSLLATQAFITSGIWTQIIKHLTGRERPEASYVISHVEGGRWYGIFSRYHQLMPDDRPGYAYDSFPSGHTATAFSIATVFATQYSDIKIIPVLSYSLASAVGFSRLTEHEHWASDVFVGALIGYLSGKEVVNNFNRMNQPHPANYISQKPERKITLTGDGRQMGISVMW